MGVTTLAWLGALATLAVPLAIHLWSRRRTTPVSIGSTRFLEGVPPVRHRTLRLRNPWRLALRLAMLTCLVLALAGPFLSPATPPRPERWLVVSPQALRSVIGRAWVDSLAPTMDEVRLLAPGWPPIDANIETAPHDVWTLLFDLDGTLPPGSHIDVVAEANTGMVEGSRPTLATAVAWHRVPSPQADAPDAALLDASHWALAVYADAERRDDGRYLAAALRALPAEGADSLTVTLRDTKDPDPVTATWIGWLSSSPPPASIMERVEAGATLLTDAGSSVAVASTISFASQVPDDRRVRLTRRSDVPVGAAVWRDDQGEPLLTVSRLGAGIHYRLATRLHPEWTDLTVRGVFPRVLRPVVVGTSRFPPSSMTERQIVPRHDPAIRDRREAGQDRVMSLFVPLWLLAVALFAIDVVLGGRGKSGDDRA